jgi:acyl-CoA thioesterase FadM
VEEEKTRRLVAGASTVMVYFDYKAQKSCEIPDPLRKRFEKVEGRTFPK